MCSVTVLPNFYIGLIGIFLATTGIDAAFNRAGCRIQYRQANTWLDYLYRMSFEEELRNIAEEKENEARTKKIAGNLTQKAFRGRNVFLTSL
jgi:hypothetical protein